jgi:hypothetical protein
VRQIVQLLKLASWNDKPLKSAPVLAQEWQVRASKLDSAGQIPAAAY